MKWTLRIVLALVVAVAAMFVVGGLLPVQHEASRTAVVGRPAGEVHALISDVRNYPAWWSDVTQVDMLVDRPGQTRFREYMSTGPVVMSVEESVPPARFVTRIDDPDQPFGGTWTFELEPLADNRTRVTITERGEVYNPLFRFMSRFVFGYTGTMDQCLSALRARLG